MELPITITNCSNNYGPFQFPEKVIPLFVTNALDDRPLPMYASTQNRREWLHVRDHCRAIELASRRRAGETYNVGSAVEASIEEIADRVLELTGKSDSLKTIVPTGRATTVGTCWTRPRSAASSAGTRDRLRRRPARDSRVVRRQPRWWEPLKERLQVERQPGANSRPGDCPPGMAEETIEAGNGALPRASAGAVENLASLRRTELPGRGAGRPNSSVVIRRTRQVKPASSKIASANSAHVHSPDAAT